MVELTTYLPGILLIYGVFLLQNASPGPNVLAVMGTAMSAGRQSGLAVSLGIACGTFTWSTMSVFGLATLIASYGYLLFYVKIAGGAYLLYLAYKAFKSALSRTDLEAPTTGNTKKPLKEQFFKGYLLNITNPKAAFGWIAIVSLGMETGAPNWVLLAIIMGTTTLSLMVHVIYAFVFSTSRMIFIYAKTRRPVQAVLGGLFTYAGYKLLTTKVS